MVTCPNCGNQQEGAAKCNRCSTLFAYYTPAQLRQSDAPASPGPNQATQHTPAATPAPLNAVSAPTLFTRIRTVYRAASWVALGIAIILFALVFHKSPPPAVAATPEAAHRAEEKIRASEADDKLGVPHRLQLDGEELNSFLNQNLAINGRTQPAAPDAGPAPAMAIPPAGTASADSTQAAAAAATKIRHGKRRAPTLEEVQSAVKDVRVDLVGRPGEGLRHFQFSRRRSLARTGWASARGKRLFALRPGERDAWLVATPPIHAAIRCRASFRLARES